MPPPVTAPSPEIRSRLEAARNLWVATVRPDGRPHLVPIWFVLSGDLLYICTAPDSVKGLNLAANPRIAVALEEEPALRLVGNLLPRAGAAINELDPATIRIGAPVRVVFEPVSDAIHLPRWVLV